MKQRSRSSNAFSLAEVTLALGVAALAFIAVLGMMPVGLKVQQASVQQTTASEIMAAILNDLRADVVLPPGQASKETDSGFGLHGHWLAVDKPSWLFFTNGGSQTGSASNNTDTPPAAPPDAVFMAKITYLFPPTATTSVANVIITWPAQVNPTTGTPAGSVGTYIAVNRQ
jgi:uncharacterized protein (TIGR02598 family)